VLAIGCVVLTAIVAALVWTPLHDRTEALLLDARSPTAVVAELVSYGLAAAIVCWVAAAIAGRGEGRVASAPRSGAFADRSASIPHVPIVPGPGAQLNHPDGASTLEHVPPRAPE
jgi:hypothetical protein